MNIFARELESLLERFQKKLGNLYGLAKDYPHLFLSNKIARLARADAEDLGAMLNVEEVQAVATWPKLDPAGGSDAASAGGSGGGMLAPDLAQTPGVGGGQSPE